MFTFPFFGVHNLGFVQPQGEWKHSYCQTMLLLTHWPSNIFPSRYTHVEKSLFVDVFGSSDGRGGDHHWLHLRQVDVPPAVGVLARVVVPQLSAEGTLEADVHSSVEVERDGGGSPGVWWCPIQTSEVSNPSEAPRVCTGSPHRTYKIKAFRNKVVSNEIAELNQTHFWSWVGMCWFNLLF